MRIAEKTIELNFCAQLNSTAKQHLIWFGLTQRQEAQLGFDACTSIGGRLLILQFKASNYRLKSGHRRFYASHAQMMLLKKLAKRPRSVFYVLPTVGTTRELAARPDLIAHSRLLDITSIPASMPPPTQGRSSVLRKTGVHYVDVAPSGLATIHSDPVQVQTLLAKEFFSQGLPDAGNVLGRFEDNFAQFWEFRRAFARNALGLVVAN